MVVDITRSYPYNFFIMIKKYLLMVWCLTAVVASAQAQSLPTENVSVKRKNVTAVEVRGNKTISLATILSKIKTRVDQEYLQGVISDDLKRLYNTGYFSDVRVDREEFQDGFRVIFHVVEKPVVGEITFSRLRYYKPKFLLKKISTKKGKFLDRKTLKDDIDVIKELYSKKGLSSVAIDVQEEADPVNNQVKLHFVIKEGPRLLVRQIHFEGNTTFSDKRLMRVVKSRRSGWFTSGHLKDQVVDEDVARLQSFYGKEGFIDARVTKETVQGRKGRIELTFTVVEGKRYYVEGVSVQGNSVVTQEEILDAMKEIRPGQVFSRDKLSLDIANVRTVYFDKGYIFAQVQDSTALHPETGKVMVRLDVFEGALAFVNKIKVQGNTRTRDIVVRREMRLYPGDRFDGAKLRRSKERLQNLGYFKDISYDTEDTDRSNYKDLIVQVEEAKTGSFNFGGGYSTVDSLVGFVEIEQRNFDFTNWPTFTGGGQRLLFRTEASSQRNSFRLSFDEPWIMDYPVSGGFDLYLTERYRDEDSGYSFDEKRKGVDLHLGKQLSEYLYGTTNYRLENIDISNFEDNVSADLLAEEGKNTISSVGFNLTRDTRDNVYNPTKGLMVSSTLDVAGGPFAGDKDFYRLSGKGSYNIPLKFDAVLEFRLHGGIVDEYGDSDGVPIYERFFSGGARTIRGYDERMVGPVDPNTEDPIGGESMLVGNAELTIPLVTFLKLAAFYDIGNVWPDMQDFASGSDYKAGVGMGLRFKTPIGPINLDYGYPLNDQPGESDRSGKFYFSVSRGF